MTTNRSRRARANKPTAPALTLPRKYRLKFAACYAYSPKGDSDVSERSRQLCGRVKNGSTKWLSTYVSCLHHEVVRNIHFRGFFNAHTVLVPIPNNPISTRASGWSPADSPLP